jgi:DNA-binding MarR family transcriptional regulator
MAKSKRKEIIAEHMLSWKKIIQLAVGWTDAIAAAQRVHPTDLIAAGYLQDAGSATAGRLAEITGLTTGAMTACIDRLERAGYARREADSGDRRKVLIKPGKLPPLSKELLRFRERTLKKIERAFSEYSDAEIRWMTEWMRKFTIALEKEVQDFRVTHRKSMAVKRLRIQ